MITIYPDLSGNQKFGSKDPNKRKQYTQDEIKRKLQYATCSRDGTIKIWNAMSLQVEQTIDVNKPKKGVGQTGRLWVNSIVYMTKSKIIAAACSDWTVKFFDPNGTMPN